VVVTVRRMCRRSTEASRVLRPPLSRRCRTSMIGRIRRGCSRSLLRHESKGGIGRMRKFPLLAVAAVVLGATVVALASAARNASTVSWLPASVVPASNNWLSGEGDESNSRFSTLKQINSNNVQNLHVVWNQQFNTDTSIAFSPEGQPICCANDLLVQAYIQGVAAMKPDTGDVVWN